MRAIDWESYMAERFETDGLSCSEVLNSVLVAFPYLDAETVEEEIEAGGWAAI